MDWLDLFLDANEGTGGQSDGQETGETSEAEDKQSKAADKAADPELARLREENEKLKKSNNDLERTLNEERGKGFRATVQKILGKPGEPLTDADKTALEDMGKESARYGVALDILAAAVEFGEVDSNFLELVTKADPTSARVALAARKEAREARNAGGGTTVSTDDVVAQVKQSLGLGDDIQPRDKTSGEGADQAIPRRNGSSAAPLIDKINAMKQAGSLRK